MTQLNYDAIIFDLDGTLIHTAPDLLAATNHVLKSCGRAPVALGAIQTAISFGALRMMHDAFMATGGLDDINLQDHMKSFLEYYNKNIAVDSHPFDGAVDLLTALNTAKIPVAVCTNKAFYLAEHLLAQLKISPFLQGLTGGDSFSAKKPDPLHLTETRRLMGLSDAHNILMVGDSKNDILAAQNAGWDSAAVTFGYSESPVETLGATYVINSLSDLKEIMGV